MSSLQTDLDRSVTAWENIMMGSLLPTTLAEQSEHARLLGSGQKNTTTKADHTFSASTYDSSSRGPTRLPTNQVWVWWKESVLLLIAIGLLIAISSILAIYTGKPLPKWTLNFNLNTVVALMATLLRSSLVMVVEEVLSQAKWTWQHRIHPIADMASFDEASRGPLGSLFLWFRVTATGRGPFMNHNVASAILASIVLVLSLAIGSFTQQAIKSVPCDIALPHLNTSLPIVYGDMYGMLLRPGAGINVLEAPTKARVFRAFAESTSERPILIQGCSTGNCTFPEVAPSGVTHITSGFCSKCWDTSNTVSQAPEATISRNENEFNYAYQYLNSTNGLGVGPIGYPYAYQTLQTDSANRSWLQTNILSSPNALEIWNISVANLNVLSLTTAGCTWSAFDGQTEDYPEGILHNYDCSYPQERRNSTTQARWNVVSASCSLYPCIKEMRARVSNGKFDEVVVDQIPIYPFEWGSREGQIGMVKSPCFIDGTRYDKHNMSLAPPSIARLNLTGSKDEVLQKCYYSLLAEIARSIGGIDSDWFTNMIYGNCSMATNQGDHPKTRSFALCGDPPFTNQWWLAGLYNRGNATFDTITATMDNVATSLTDSLRLNSIAEHGMNANNTINGTVWQSSVCTDFDWRWLLFPVGLIALTVSSLILMIAFTALSRDQIPVWKSSILPFFYLGRTPSHNAMHTISLDELQKAAREDEVVLRRNEVGEWRLVSVQEEREGSAVNPYQSSRAN